MVRRRVVSPSFASGFTLVELVVVIILLGILSVSVLPRLTGGNEFRSGQLRDEVAAALRYAQKTAVSHRRMVCVAVSGDVLSLSIASAHPANACDVALPVPGGNATVAVGGVSLAMAPGNLTILPSGQVVGNNQAQYDFVIAGGEHRVVLWGETGHVE